LSGNGSWGPFKLERGAHYEFAISRSTGTHHLYYEPFQHDNHLIRLLTAEPNTGLDALTEKSDRHAVLIVTRNKELWGDQGAANDVLTINGTNVINAATSPQSKRTSGLFAFDAGSDGQTNVGAPLPAFFSLPFISGVDLAIPASRPPDGRISVRLRRGAAAGCGRSTSRTSRPPRTGSRCSSTTSSSRLTTPRPPGRPGPVPLR
jgi:AF_1763-like, C-terminal domain/Lipase C-terminal domain